MERRVKKAQAASELLIAFMFVLFIFTILVSIFAQQRSQEVLREKTAVADQIGSNFAEEINLAARSEDGYSQKFSFPRKLEGVTPYTVILNTLSNSVDINFSFGALNISHSFKLLFNSANNTIVSPQVNASLPNGNRYGYVIFSTATSPTGYLYIGNVGGVIIISNFSQNASVPYSIAINAFPTSITADMVNTSNITVVVLNQWGMPVDDGTPVRFYTDNGFIQGVATTSNGVAVSFLRGNMSSGVANVNASVYGISNTTPVTFTAP